jgi:hypothetical protein
MIQDEAEPNTDSKTKAKDTKLEQKIAKALDNPQKKLVDPNKLKKLSNIFNQKND